MVQVKTEESRGGGSDDGDGWGVGGLRKRGLGEEEEVEESHIFSSFCCYCFIVGCGFGYCEKASCDEGDEGRAIFHQSSEDIQACFEGGVHQGCNPPIAFIVAKLCDCSV